MLITEGSLWLLGEGMQSLNEGNAEKLAEIGPHSFHAAQMYTTI